MIEKSIFKKFLLSLLPQSSPYIYINIIAKIHCTHDSCFVNISPRFVVFSRSIKSFTYVDFLPYVCMYIHTIQTKASNATVATVAIMNNICFSRVIACAAILPLLRGKGYLLRCFRLNVNSDFFPFAT